MAKKKKKQYEYNIVLYEVMHQVYHTRAISRVEGIEYILTHNNADYRALHVTCDELCLTEYGRRFIGKFADMVRDNPKDKNDQYRNCFFIKKIDELGKLDDVTVEAEQSNGYLCQEDRNIFSYLKKVGVLFVIDDKLLNMLRDDAGLEVCLKTKMFDKYGTLEPNSIVNKHRPRFILIQKVEKE